MAHSTADGGTPTEPTHSLLSISRYTLNITAFALNVQIPNSIMHSCLTSNFDQIGKQTWKVQILLCHSAQYGFYCPLLRRPDSRHFLIRLKCRKHEYNFTYALQWRGVFTAQISLNWRATTPNVTKTSRSVANWIFTELTPT